MDRHSLEQKLAAVMKRLPTSKEKLLELGAILEENSYNPEGAEAIRTGLKEKQLEAEAYYFNSANGAGDSDSLWILDSERGLEALYLRYDHESSLNFYGAPEESAYSLQAELYRGLPSELRELLTGPEGELLTIRSFEGEGVPLYHGSAVFYLTEGSWKAPESYKELALAYEDDGGVSYSFNLEELEGKEEL